MNEKERIIGGSTDLPAQILKKQMSWIIWAVAGVLYGAVTGIISLVMKSKDK